MGGVLLFGFMVVECIFEYFGVLFELIVCCVIEGFVSYICDGDIIEVVGMFVWFGLLDCVECGIV